MESTTKLTRRERHFFSLVRQAALTNPFSDKRVKLDLAICGLKQGASEARNLERVVQAVDKEISTLKRQGKASVSLFAGEDREIIRYSLLFHVYYRHAQAFDQLIERQVKSGDRPLKVPFARSAITSLVGYGCPETEAYRYFAIFYQMRRAFYFIEQRLVGTSPCMKQLRLDLWNNVFTYDIGLYEKYLWDRMEDFSTLLLGETGTGKGTAAAAIGRSGFIPFNPDKQCFEDRFTRSLISLNLSQFSESLIESELFGHRKGAFTGAVDTHEGILEQCGKYRSIFLDEIGDTSVAIQIKLLQVLQERTFSPVGSHQTKRFQGRVIAATNHEVDALRTRGRFRDDFFYRLCSDIIKVPSLKQRLEEEPRELKALLSYTIERLVGRPSPELVDIVEDVIVNNLGIHYHWPGNVRELEQCVRRVLLKRDYWGDLHRENPQELPNLLEQMETGSLDAQSLLSQYCTILYKKLGTFEQVARRVNLDRRTVKKYIEKSA